MSSGVERRPIEFEDLYVVVGKDDETSEPWARITINRGIWHGYTFKLVMPGGDVCRLEIERTDDAAPLTGRRLREVPLPLMERFARSGIDAASEGSEHVLGFALFSPEEWPGQKSRQHANRDDVKLAKLAQAYVETLGQSQQANLLAERFDLSPRSITTLIRRARERHLLTATSRGRAGGSLTPRAREILVASASDGVEPPRERGNH